MLLLVSYKALASDVYSLHSLKEDKNMDIIILGLLMIKRSTIYEMKQVIRHYLSPISSDSTGSIQAGIKKLLNKELITYKEQVENGVNKKVYSITEAGKKYFIDNLSVPMSYKEKNMELNKLFFMGFIDKNEQIASIKKYIQEMEKELDFLEQINASLNPRFEFEQSYIDNIRQNHETPDLFTEEKFHEIAKFQYAMLDFGIDKLKFEIGWFNDFNKKLEMESN